MLNESESLWLAHFSDLHYSPGNLAESDRCFGFAVENAIDLVARLELDSEEGALQLKAFAAATFGRGWSKRPHDVRQFVKELRTALANPLAFREQVATIAADVLP
ncbi:hypothetical protein ACIP1U_16190 [Cupriavidus sp. NPDC089707]|uniref:hypothetical protein n=1 Tax=Cupriavidus sp. NPDC089707 TaxID=3363963 RepID=UPI00380E1215